MSTASGWTRRASHAGSWYIADPAALKRQLADWLALAGGSPSAAGGAESPRAIVAPHAGYRYSGEVAAHAYRVLAEAADAADCRLRRVFVLGPSHHRRLEGCALTAAATLETPLGELAVDRVTVAQLSDSGRFAELPPDLDEAEHSVEMQLPYVAMATAGLRRRTVDGAFAGLVPILVGQCTAEQTAAYAGLLAPHLADPAAFFVISSDFCHWGRRFRYVRRGPAPEPGGTRDPGDDEPIWRGIERLDRLGMQAIESLDAGRFADYLDSCGNTICGRKPIALLLAALAAAGGNGDGAWAMRFLRYAQSARCLTEEDSSVSYAAGALFRAVS